MGHFFERKRKTPTGLQLSGGLSYKGAERETAGGF